MTVDEAKAAVLFAEDVIRECDEDPEILDGVSDLSDIRNNCPPGFTEEQFELAHALVLLAYERAIGRA